MKYTILTLIIMFVFLLLGCENLKEQTLIIKDRVNDGMHAAPYQGITINEHFGKNITKYNETTLGGRINCLSGECPEVDFKIKTEEKDCYFCPNTKIVEKEFRMYAEGTSGGFNAFFGCRTSSEGPYINGMDIVEINDNIIRIKGEIRWDIEQKSVICNKSRDPDCNDQTYGTCATPDYTMQSIRQVEFEIRS